MKKSIFIAVLGLAAGVASSYGQGYVIMNSYSGNESSGFTTTFFSGNSPVDSSFTAELYFALGTVSDPVNNSLASSITSPISGLFTALPSSIIAYDANGDGYFGANPVGPTVTIPTYTSGPISFEILAYNTAGTFIGRSGSWTESMIGAVSSPSNFGDNGTAPNFFVASVVPEPTTLALAGLGGLASLVAFRRKQS